MPLTVALAVPPLKVKPPVGRPFTVYEVALVAETESANAVPTLRLVVFKVLSDHTGSGCLLFIVKVFEFADGPPEPLVALTTKLNDWDAPAEAVPNINPPESNDSPGGKLPETME